MSALDKAAQASINSLNAFASKVKTRVSNAAPAARADAPSVKRSSGMKAKLKQWMQENPGVKPTAEALFEAGIIDGDKFQQLQAKMAEQGRAPSKSAPAQKQLPARDELRTELRELRELFSGISGELQQLRAAVTQSDARSAAALEQATQATHAFVEQQAQFAEMGTALATSMQMQREIMALLNKREASKISTSDDPSNLAANGVTDDDNKSAANATPITE